MTPLLTIEQVAELLDCSRDTVTGRLARNELPGGPVLRYLVHLSRIRMAYSAPGKCRSTHTPRPQRCHLGSGPSPAASAAQASATTRGTATGWPVERLIPVR